MHTKSEGKSGRGRPDEEPGSVGLRSGVAPAGDGAVDAERQAARAARLEAVGQLAAGVAHDLNNALGLVMSYTTLVLGTFDGGDPRRGDLDQVLRACRRAAGVLRQLTLFSQSEGARPKPLALRELLPSFDTTLRLLLGEAIERTTDLQDEGVVMVDPTQLEQIVLNLARNARDAMPGGGLFSVSTASVVLREPKPTATGLLPPGPYVTLTVADTGVGIPREHRPRLFEPFFTTKPPGKGLGLGLPTVCTLVQRAAGAIEVDTEIGRGTTFTLYFPDAAPAGRRAGTRARDSEGGAADAAAGLVLLVEDEDDARAAMVQLLAQNGHAVRSFAAPAAALRFLEEEGASAAALVSDIDLGAESGVELVRAARARWPHLLCLLMSGYGQRHAPRIPADVALLAKPVEPSLLLAHLEQARL